MFNLSWGSFNKDMIVHPWILAKSKSPRCFISIASHDMVTSFPFYSCQMSDARKIKTAFFHQSQQCGNELVETMLTAPDGGWCSDISAKAKCPAPFAFGCGLASLFVLSRALLGPVRLGSGPAIPLHFLLRTRGGFHVFRMVMNGCILKGMP